MNLSRAWEAVSVITLAISAAVMVALQLGDGNSGAALQPSRRCSDFGTQVEAQAYWDRNPSKQLDADGDGRVCERLP
jgi:hypothetical protein